jgi:hypothetical protein
MADDLQDRVRNVEESIRTVKKSLERQCDTLKSQDEVHEVVMTDVEGIKQHLISQDERTEALGKQLLDVLDGNKEEIRCLSVNFRRYEPMLTEMRQDQQAHAKLRKAIVERSAVGIVWATIVVVAISLWQYLKHSLE